MRQGGEVRGNKQRVARDGETGARATGGGSGAMGGDVCGDPRGVAELEKAATRFGDADRADARDCLRRLNQAIAPTAARTPG